MAVGTIIKRGARILYKDAKGRFTSAANFARMQGVENYMRAQLGAPPSGKSWVQIAGKYPDRFADYLAEIE